MWFLIDILQWRKGLARRVLPFLVGIATAILLATPIYAATMQVICPADEVPGDPRFNDLREILDVALKKTVSEFGPYVLSTAPMTMSKARYMSELRNGESTVLNLAWSSTSIELERDFLPVRIPLRKGLLGYRVLLIEKRFQPLFDAVTSLKDLQKLTAGQGKDWGDVAVLEANGIHVVQANYASLFRMLKVERFDMFPRGVAEAYAEQAKYGDEDPDLAVENGLLLYYPWPYYFFVRKSDKALHDRVEKGLRMMIRDGSFEAIFRKYNQAAIDKAHLTGRRLIRLKNPLLPPDTPLADKTLWFDPGLSR